MMNHALGENSRKARRKHHFQKIPNTTFHLKVKERNEHRLRNEGKISDNGDDFIE